MTHPVGRFDHAALAAPLQLYPCPGTQSTDASNTLGTLKAAGTKAVVTLMPHEEMARLGIPDLGALCSEIGLQQESRVKPQATPGAFDIQPPRILGDACIPGRALRAYPGDAPGCNHAASPSA